MMSGSITPNYPSGWVHLWLMGWTGPCLSLLLLTFSSFSPLWLLSAPSLSPPHIAPALAPDWLSALQNFYWH